MDKSLFRNWDNSNRYIKAPYQGNIAKIGHLEFLYDYLNENSLPDWVASEEGYNEGQVVFATNAIYRSDVSNNTTTPPSSDWTKLADISTPYEPPYKVYRALLTQTGTNPPVATILENTLGQIPTYGYVNIGRYTLSVTGNILTDNKTAVSFGSNIDISNVDSATILTNSLTTSGFTINTFDTSTSAFNGILSKTLIEIKVYE